MAYYRPMLIGNGMNKLIKNEIEPVVAASALAAEALLSEVYGPPPANMQTKGSTFSSRPAEVSIDRDGDGTADSVLKTNYTWAGSLSEMTLEKTGGTGNTRVDLKANRDILGHVTSIDFDRNGDGIPDAHMTVERSIWTKVSSLSIDNNNDGTVDSTLRIRRGWWSGRVSGIDVDADNDGKVDYQLETQRTSAAGLTIGLK
jgi:hypothetical protein